MKGNWKFLWMTFFKGIEKKNRHFYHNHHYQATQNVWHLNQTRKQVGEYFVAWICTNIYLLPLFSTGLPMLPRKKKITVFLFQFNSSFFKITILIFSYVHNPFNCPLFLLLFDSFFLEINRMKGQEIVLILLQTNMKPMCSMITSFICSRVLQN